MLKELLNVFFGTRKRKMWVSGIMVVFPILVLFVWLASLSEHPWKALAIMFATTFLVLMLIVGMVTFITTLDP